MYDMVLGKTTTSSFGLMELVEIGSKYPACIVARFARASEKHDSQQRITTQTQSSTHSLVESDVPGGEVGSQANNWFQMEMIAVQGSQKTAFTT